MICSRRVTKSRPTTATAMPHNVGSVDRARIYRALLARWRSAPLGFFLPPRRTV